MKRRHYRDEVRSRSDLEELLIWLFAFYLMAFLICGVFAPDLAIRFWPLSFFIHQ